MPASILIVEDEAIVALDMQSQLEELGYTVVGIADHCDRALALVAQHRPDLVLMDVQLQGAVDGIATSAAIANIARTPVIYLTAHSDLATVQRAADTAPYGYLTKPFQLRELRAAIEVALAKARMERQLAESERWFASTLQCVQDGILLTGMDGQLRFVNPAAEVLTGWSTDTAIGKPVQEIVRFGPGARPSDAVDRALAAGAVVGIEHALPLLRRDGREVPVDQSAAPINDDQGNRLGAVLLLRDARRRLQQEAQLRASEERFRSAFDHAPLGMALVALDGAILQSNAVLCQLLGRDAATLRALGHERLTWPEDRMRERQHLRSLLAGNEPLLQFEKRYLRAGSDEPVWTLVSVSLLRDNGEPTCWLYQVHDLTEHKRVAAQMAELAHERMLRQASEMADRAKTEFLSRASHEMRTPLNAVLGFAHLLRDGLTAGDEGRTRRYGEQIYAAGEHLLAMVNDVLDLQRAAQGGLQMQISDVPLAATVEMACSLLGAQAAAMPVTVECRIASDVKVRADETRLRQVLINLGSNAIKYNRAGGRVTLSAEFAGPGRVRITVADTGIGLSEAQHAHLFEPFQRLGQERSNIPGVGLGLLIARNLVQQMNGSLRLDSTPGVGTQVVIELPAA